MSDHKQRKSSQMNCFMYKALRKNDLQAYDSRIESLVGAYTVIGWRSRKRNGIIFSIKGIAFFLKVWYNTDKGNGLVFGPGSTCGGDVPRHFLLEGV